MGHVQPRVVNHDRGQGSSEVDAQLHISERDTPVDVPLLAVGDESFELVIGVGQLEIDELGVEEHLHQVLRQALLLVFQPQVDLRLLRIDVPIIDVGLLEEVGLGDETLLLAPQLL